MNVILTEWSDDMYDYLNGYSYGWGKYGKYNFGIDSFGKSGKASAVIEDFGFDTTSIYEKVKKIIDLINNLSDEELFEDGKRNWAKTKGKKLNY